MSTQPISTTTSAPSTTSMVSLRPLQAPKVETTVHLLTNSNKTNQWIIVDVSGNETATPEAVFTVFQSALTTLNKIHTFSVGSNYFQRKCGIFVETQSLQDHANMQIILRTAGIQVTNEIENTCNSQDQAVAFYNEACGFNLEIEQDNESVHEDDATFAGLSSNNGQNLSSNQNFIIPNASQSEALPNQGASTTTSSTTRPKTPPVSFESNFSTLSDTPLIGSHTSSIYSEASLPPQNKHLSATFNPPDQNQTNLSNLDQATIQEKIMLLMQAHQQANNLNLNSSNESDPNQNVHEDQTNFSAQAPLQNQTNPFSASATTGLLPLSNPTSADAAAQNPNTQSPNEHSFPKQPSIDSNPDTPKWLNQQPLSRPLSELSVESQTSAVRSDDETNPSQQHQKTEPGSTPRKPVYQTFPKNWTPDTTAEIEQSMKSLRIDSTNPPENDDPEAEITEEDGLAINQKLESKKNESDSTKTREKTFKQKVRFEQTDQHSTHHIHKHQKAAHSTQQSEEHSDSQTHHNNRHSKHGNTQYKPKKHGKQ